jgi:hypothetical protein
MPREEDIDDQVRMDLEFTRRAEQLLNKLRTQGTVAGVSAEDRPAGDDDPSNQK